MKLELVVVFLTCSLGLVLADVAVDNDLYQIEHSIDFGEFVPIGHVNLRLLKQSQNAAQYQNLESLETNSKSSIPAEQPSTELETFKLEQTQLGRIRQASQQNENNSMYHVRMCKKALPNQAQICLTSSFTYLR